MSAPVILLEATPSRASDGVTETVRLAGGGGQLPYTYFGLTDWRAGIVQLPTLITSLVFEGGEIGQGGVPAAAEIAWGPARTADLAAVAGYYWKDAPVTVWIGPEGADPPVAIAGTVLEATSEGGVFKLALADPAAELKKAFPVERFAGTGELEGPAEWDGRLRRRVWGRVFNQPGEPIDKANNIYVFADPLRPIEAIVAVRDKGAAAAALDMLAWAGSAAATFAALQAAEAPQGGGVIAPSIAAVKWWTQPAGALCADLKGEIGVGYVETAAEIAERVVSAAGGPTFAAGAVAGAALARPGPAGWALRDEGTTAAAMLDDLLGPVSLLWVLDASGSIVLREWAWTAIVASARSQGVTRKRTFKPLATRRLGYQRNELPMARGDIAAIVFEAAYPDGTPIGDLQPAQANADVTADNQVIVEIITDLTIAADATANLTGDLADVVWSPRVTRGGASIRVENSTTYALSGAVGGTFAVDNTNGSDTKGNVTITAMSANTATVDLTVSVDGVAQPKVTLKLSKTLASGSSGGGGGGGGAPATGSVSWASGEYVAINSTSYVPVTGSAKTLTLGSGQSFHASASLDYTVSGQGGINRTMTVKAQYAVAGSGSWNDFGSGVTGSIAFAAFSSGPPDYDWESASPGHVDYTASATPSAGDYDIRLVGLLDATGRNVLASGPLMVTAS